MSEEDFYLPDFEENDTITNTLTSTKSKTKVNKKTKKMLKQLKEVIDNSSLLDIT